MQYVWKLYRTMFGYIIQWLIGSCKEVMLYDCNSLRLSALRACAVYYTTCVCSCVRRLVCKLIN